jgi:indoleamine 2,3-dioxygenase
LFHWLQNFLGGPDEEWFRCVHIAIEATAAPAIACLPLLQTAAAEGDGEGLEQQLAVVAAALQRMTQLLGRMGEKCDPYIYYNRYGAGALTNQCLSGCCS